MVSSINSLLSTSLFGIGGTTNTVGVDADMLTAWARSRAGVGADTSALTQDPNAPLAPVWQPGISPSTEALVQRAVANRAFFDVNAKLYADLGATGDYRRLFALYSGLSMLNALAGKAGEEGISNADFARVNQQFMRGVAELNAFFGQQQFDGVRLAQADRVSQAQTTLAMPVKSEDYLTGVIHRGGLYDRVSGLAPDAAFEIVATSGAGTERRVAINLAEMGSIPRTLGNVVSHINGKLAAAGAASRLETVDQTPKETSIVIAGRTIKTRYTGPKQYALKVDVRAGERVAFEPTAATPAFYALGAAGAGARLIKLEDVGAAAGQPVWLNRPPATADATGVGVATGWTASAGAFEQRSNAILSDGPNTTEDALRAAGEAVLKLQFADGRVMSVTTAWRAGDQENWRALAGDSSDGAIAGDLAERLSQLLHEQGVAARVEAWEDDGQFGLSVFSDDLVQVTALTIGGKAVRFDQVDPPGMVGGLRDGVFARRFEAAGVGAGDDLFIGTQSFVVTTANATHTISIDGGEDGIDAATLAEKLNEQLRARNIAAAAYLDDVGGALTLRVDALHDTLAVTATLNEESYAAALRTPGAWVAGGLPLASAGQPFGDAVRTRTAAETPLITHTGALEIAVVVETGAGQRTINLSVSASDRLANPDAAPGQWDEALQARLDAALNEAGVYVSASDDLRTWRAAENAGQRIASVTINGDALTLSGDAPDFALGGAFSGERSFTSATLAGDVSDAAPALAGDQTVSITFDTIWGQRTVSTALQAGDPHTLESAALRLNEALAAQGYDVGVIAANFASGAGVRVVAGASHSVRGVSQVTLGASAHPLTLDPVDASSHVDNPIGAQRVADRAARGAALTEANPRASTLIAPSNGVSGWFPGRAFDVAVGGGAKVATARAVAAGSDGGVYVLADLDGDSAIGAIKGARDVALLKYDGAGKLVFSQMLGASQSASGFALAVSADGKVAVAGAVEGALSGADAARGALDSFVTLFDSNGAEIWTRRQGATANDQVNAVSFASDGAVIVAGKTESALGASLSLGGADSYVRGYSAAGVQLFTRQFGTAGADTATALLVRDAAGGGIEIFTGGVEGDRGVVRSFTYAADAGFAAGAVRDIGYFRGGEINSIVAEGAALYVGGGVGADRLAVGGLANASTAGQDGFVARIATDLGSTALDRVSYLGSTGDDAVKALSIVNGHVYAAGTAGGAIAGQGATNAKASFLARLDADGEVDWARSFNAANGSFSLTSLAVDTSGVSALDVLGLPRGAIAAADAAPLVTRSALRAGDEFLIGVEGRRLTTIRISATDTMASLVSAVKRAVGGAGRVELVKDGDVERLRITPFEGHALRVAPGRAGKDALAGLGLSDGVIAMNSTARGAMRTYGLGLSEGDLRLDSKGAIASTRAELAAATSMVRQIYETLLNPNAKELTPEEQRLAELRQKAGVAPEYFSQRLANYQAALARLNGG